MRRRTLVLRLLVPAALVVLVAALATLQYHWVGQVSEAERDRLQKSLRTEAQDFADAFDAELLWIQMAFQAGGAVGAGDDEAFARTFDNWHDKARDPQLVRDVYLMDGAAAAAPALRRFDRAARRFIDVPWPVEFAAVRARAEALRHVDPSPLAAAGKGEPAGSKQAQSKASFDLPAPPRDLLMLRDPIVASVPAMLVSLPTTVQASDSGPRGVVSVRFGDRLLIVQLDRQVIARSMLPALAAQYFAGTDADAYRMAILDRSTSPSNGRPDRSWQTAPIVFARGVPAGVRIDPARADATVPLLSLRFELGARVAPRLGLPASSGQATGTLPNTVGHLGLFVRQQAPDAGSGSPGPTSSAKTEAVAVYVQSRGVRSQVLRINSSDMTGAPTWQLVLQHPAGSLDAAVAIARRRNMWLSFGVLAVLAVGVMLVVINAQRAQRLAAQQMDFVATVSHELRTPLAVIRSAAQNLSAGVVHDGERTRHYGEMIDREGRRLSDMVEQVLEYAGLHGNRKAGNDTIDLGSLAHEAAAPWMSMENGVRLCVDVADDVPAVRGDEAALRRVLDNLIANAVKHGGSDGEIGVSVRRTALRARDHVLVTVQDHGPGIAASDLAHVFEPFYRGKRAAEQQVPGNGLGLSLVKRIVEAHGGRVSVKSSPGHGALFAVYLPSEKWGRT